MLGFNPETAGGDNRDLISRLERISKNCEEILYIITIAARRNDSKRPSFKDDEVNKVKNKVNAISAAATGFLTELTSKISIEQRGLLEADISALTVEIMTLKELLGRQKVNIDEVQAQVERVQKIANDIKNNLKRSR
jgi:archaellum component FlaC